jgi:hypothetical protein
MKVFITLVLFYAGVVLAAAAGHLLGEYCAVKSVEYLDNRNMKQEAL